MAAVSGSKWESNYPSLLSAFCVVCTAIFLLECPSWIRPVGDGLKTLSPSALNVSAIAVGFLATSQSLLLSLAGTPALAKLRASHHYERLLEFFSKAIAASFITAILSAVLSTIHLEKGGWLRLAVVGIWLFEVICAFLCYYRISKLMGIVLRFRAKANAPDETGASGVIGSLSSSEDEIELLDESD